MIVNPSEGSSSLFLKKIKEYLLYDDDGETFDYEKGAYSWREIHVTKGKDGKLKSISLTTSELSLFNS
jgi:alpha-glucosidase (family GH31 glycosyl hydrolase)